MRVAAILVAAGSGSRFGTEVPKQFLVVAGKPVIRHAAEALAAHVSLLQPVGDAAPIEAALDGRRRMPTVVQGGATRQDSVRAGLEALVPHEPDIVLVHDAARPVIPEGTIPALLAALLRIAGRDSGSAGRRHAEAGGARRYHRDRTAGRAVPCPDPTGLPVR